MTGASSKPAVIADLRTFSSRIDYRETVEDILRYVPNKYLVGLDRVVIRDRGGLIRKELMRERKRGLAAMGLYYRATRTHPAHIELFIDEIVEGWPRPLLWCKAFREVLLTQTLFHELGHHVHSHLSPEHRDRESVAKTWSSQLVRDYLRRRFWYLRPLRRPIRLLVHNLSVMIRKRRSRSRGS